MDGKWITTKAGRAVIAVGGVLIAVATVGVVMTSGDGDASRSGPEVGSIVSTDATSPATSPPTSEQVADTASAPASTEAADSTAAQTLVTVPVDTVAVLDPIPLDETGDFGTGLAVRLIDIEAIDGEARTQGEVAGPALRVTVEVTNNSNEPISLERTQVDVTSGNDRTPGIVLSGSGTAPFPASVAPGASTTGTVVFIVPLDQRDVVQVAVTQTTGTPIVVFEGTAP